ncbi:MAG TPA: polysaccharide deacetylase family protein, partial [candidate division Zixibacteria bacterium]|nr:polysaccharide deacetylase family protein [candidate division Zixibacteria bacterium]
MSSITKESDTPGFKATAQTRNILVFHKLSNQITFGSTNYSPERLILLFESLIDSGYEFGPIQEVLTGHNSKKLSVTFDDGYAHLLRTLPRLIDKYKIKPVIFVPTAFMGEKNRWDYSFRLRDESHLDSVQMAELSEMGCEFGTHGHRHLDLTKLDE